MSAALCCGVMNAWAQPATSAPTPPEYATNRVISLYSDAYANPVAWNFADWGSGTTYAQEVVAGTQDNVAKFTTTELGYFGWELQSDVNAVTMTHLHLDVWSEAAFEFDLTPICRTQPNGEQPQKVQVKAGEWTQIELTVQSYTDLSLDMSGVFQLKFSSTGARTFYVDNVYFYSNSTEVDEEAPSKPEVSVVSTSYFNAVLSCNATDNSGSVTYNVTADGGITATGGGVSGAAANVTVSGLQAGTEYTFTVTASDLDGNTSDPVTVTATAPVMTAAVPATVPATAAPAMTARISAAAAMGLEGIWPGYAIGAVAAILGMVVQFMMHSRKVGKKEKVYAEQVKEADSVESEVEKARMVLDDPEEPEMVLDDPEEPEDEDE